MNDNNGFNIDNNFDVAGNANGNGTVTEPVTYDSYYNHKPRKTPIVPIILIIAAVVIVIVSLWLGGVFTPVNSEAEYNKLFGRVCSAAITYAEDEYSEAKAIAGKIIYIKVSELANANLIEANLRNYLTNEPIAADTDIRMEVLPSKTFQCHGFVFAGDDLVKPIVTLKGDAIIYGSVGAAVTDPGATASDDKDGDISDKIKRSGNVDTDYAGTYKVNYVVSDRSGNLSSVVQRTYIIQ